MRHPGFMGRLHDCAFTNGSDWGARPPPELLKVTCVPREDVWRSTGLVMPLDTRSTATGWKQTAELRAKSYVKWMCTIPSPSSSHNRNPTVATLSAMLNSFRQIWRVSVLDFIWLPLKLSYLLDVISFRSVTAFTSNMSKKKSNKNVEHDFIQCSDISSGNVCTFNYKIK